MLTATSTAKNIEVPRDRYSRPLIHPEAGGPAVPYDRISSLGKTLDDSSALDAWRQRLVARGVATHPHLAALAASTDDTKTLNRVAKDALEASGGSVASATGSAIHKFTELADKGLPYGHAPADIRPLVDGYLQALDTWGLEPVAIEEFLVVDSLQVAGTLDRVVRSKITGRYYVADLKTGKSAPEYAAATAVQVACYAYGRKYHPKDGRRSKLLPVDTSRGLLIHLPVDGRPCTLHTLDLVAGWNGAQVARWVKTWRKHNPCSPLTTATVL